MGWIVALLLAAQPAKEHAERLARVAQQAADGEVSIGDYLRDQKMRDWARAEYAHAVRIVPRHERANRGLGRTKWNAEEERWEEDPGAKAGDGGNQRKGEDAAKVWAEYQKRLDAHGKRIAKMYVDLGGWCSRALADQPLRAAEAYQSAILADPDNAEARGKLGHVKPKGGFWVSKDVDALRREMREGIAKAPKGKALDAKSAVEEKLAIKTTKQGGDHVAIESPHLDAKTLEKLVQYGEHAYAMMHKLLGQKPAEGGVVLTILKDKAQHEKFVDAFYEDEPEEERKFSKELGRTAFEIHQGDLKNGALEDWVIHRVVMVCCFEWFGGERLGIHEGLACVFTRQMHDTAAWHCTQFSTATGQRSGKETWPEPSKWGDTVREWLRAGSDPEALRVFRCEDATQFAMADGIKAWSLMEFLLAQHREPLLDFTQRILAQEPEAYEKTFEEVFGWTFAELDRHWRVWARAQYAAP